MLQIIMAQLGEDKHEEAQAADMPEGHSWSRILQRYTTGQINFLGRKTMISIFTKLPYFLPLRTPLYFKTMIRPDPSTPIS